MLHLTTVPLPVALCSPWRWWSLRHTLPRHTTPAPLYTSLCFFQLCKQKRSGSLEHSLLVRVGGPQEDSNLRNKDSSVKPGDGGLMRGLFPALYANRTSYLVSKHLVTGLEMESAYLACTKPSFGTQHPIKLGMVVRICNANTHRVEAGR